MPHFARPAMLILAAALLLGTSGASAADRLRVGKAQPQAFSFIPLDIGVRTGIFKKLDLDIEIIGFSGGPRLHQAVAAGDLDIALGSGPDLPFLVKGAPEIAVAAMAGPPLVLGILVPYESPIRSAADLEGKRFGVASGASITGWLALELARQRGWGAHGVTLVSLGAEFSAHIAAMKTGQVDATVEPSALGLQLEETKVARLLMPASDYVTDFVTHIIFATKELAGRHPELVRRFLKGWFETIAYMRHDRADTIQIARAITGFSPAVEEREYDLVMPMFSSDGKFDAKGLEVLRRSFVELKLLDEEPDLSKLLTEEFLPK